MNFLQNKYTKWYYNIIIRAKSRGTESGCEKHHIIPECFYKIRKRKGPPGWLDGNANDKENIVSLTTKEHFICHLLLTKMVDGKAKSKMHLALLTMARYNSDQDRYKISSNSYAMIRKNVSLENSGEKNPMWGKIRTEDECKRIADGIAKSEKAAARIYNVSDEHKKAISDSKKNVSRPQSVIDAMVAGRKKVSFDNNSGKKWYNNGIKSFLSKECLPGCIPGRLPY